jgi:hypothetical protein
MEKDESRTPVVTAVILNVNDKFVAHSPKFKLPDVCSLAMNYYVSLSLTNWKSSVLLRALYFPRTALWTFTPRRDQLMICGLVQLNTAEAFMRNWQSLSQFKNPLPFIKKTINPPVLYRSLFISLCK